MTIEEAAVEVNMTRSTLQRLEKGSGFLRPAVIYALLTRYGAPDEDRDRLVDLAKEAHKSEWWRTFSDVLPGRLGDLIALENEAVVINGYDTALVPGLVQTADYARTVIRQGFERLSDEEVERHVEVRLTRQKRLSAPDQPEICIIIDEPVLVRPVGGAEVMRDQINALLKLSKRPNVTIQIMPLSAGAHSGLPGSMAILEFADSSDASIVYFDTVAGDVLLEKATDVRRCRQIFSQLRSLALSPESSRDRLNALQALRSDHGHSGQSVAEIE